MDDLTVIYIWAVLIILCGLLKKEKKMKEKRRRHEIGMELCGELWEELEGDM